MNRVGVVVAITGIAVFVAGIMMFRSSNAPPDTSRADVATERPANARGIAPPSAIATPTREPARPSAKRGPASTAGEGATAPALPAVETGSLRVVSDVAAAQVFLNRQFVGTTPVTAGDLKPGTYQLNVSAPGFDPHVETVEITSGSREIPVNFRAVRLDASLEVIHRHRLGSCRGTLVATPSGLRYDTTDKDDLFSARLQDLDTFQVGYPNKNLRVQPKRGKRYDFTDPEGNADRLFVFHRDVERARERLKQGATQ